MYDFALDAGAAMNLEQENAMGDDTATAVPETEIAPCEPANPGVGIDESANVPSEVLAELAATNTTPVTRLDAICAPVAAAPSQDGAFDAVLVADPVLVVPPEPAPESVPLAEVGKGPESVDVYGHRLPLAGREVIYYGAHGDPVPPGTACVAAAATATSARAHARASRPARPRAS